MDINKQAEQNDIFRHQIPHISPPDQLVVTRGIASLPHDVVFRILQQVKDFDRFTRDNDPWEEHDFGSFEYQDRKIFWKIDDYGYRRVLTVMYAEEY